MFQDVAKLDYQPSEQIWPQEMWMKRTLQEQLCWNRELIKIITESLLHDVASYAKKKPVLQRYSNLADAELHASAK